MQNNKMIHIRKEKEKTAKTMDAKCIDVTRVNIFKAGILYKYLLYINDSLTPDNTERKCFLCIIIVSTMKENKTATINHQI